MHDAVRIEIVPRTVAADEQTREDRAETARRMVNLGMLDTVEGGQPGDTMTDGWTARINGVSVPAVTFGVEPVRPGDPVLVSLLIPADEVSVVRHRDQAGPVAAPPRPAEEKPAVSTWDAANKPDPRASIPGWKPEASEVHLSPAVEYSPNLGEQVARNVREHVQRSGNVIGRFA